jgi:hypothetical protein
VFMRVNSRCAHHSGQMEQRSAVGKTFRDYPGLIRMVGQPGESGLLTTVVEPRRRAV